MQKNNTVATIVRSCNAAMHLYCAVQQSATAAAKHVVDYFCCQAGNSNNNIRVWRWLARDVTNKNASS